MTPHKVNLESLIFLRRKIKSLDDLQIYILNAGTMKFSEFQIYFSWGRKLAASEEKDRILVQDSGTITIHICSRYMNIPDF